MTAKIINSLKILAIIVVVPWLLLRGFTFWFWREWDIAPTLYALQENKNSLDSLVVWAEQPAAIACLKNDQLKNCLPPQLQIINSKFDGAAVSYQPLVVEVTPVNFYYVLVYTKRPEDVQKSGVYHDEGTILWSIDRHWTLVRRGWM
jgi:hypothetical protein